MASGGRRVVGIHVVGHPPVIARSSHLAGEAAEHAAQVADTTPGEPHTGDHADEQREQQAHDPEITRPGPVDRWPVVGPIQPGLPFLAWG